MRRVTMSIKRLKRFRLKPSESPSDHVGIRMLWNAQQMKAKVVSAGKMSANKVANYVVCLIWNINGRVINL